jgi:PAS domain S-box-containing protein
VTTDRAESDGREFAEQFRELMAHLRQIFWIKSAADDAVLYVSPAWAEITGRTCRSLTDDFRTFLDAVHPQDRERVARATAGQLETSGYEEEYRIVRPDGGLRWIRARSYPIRDGEGRISRFAGLAEDITERRSLEEDRARLAAIVEYSEDAIVSMSADCTVIGWNRGAERQYGYTAEEIVGCSLSVLFPAERFEEYLRILDTVRRGEPVSSRGTVRRRKDGTLVDVSVNIFPIEARSGEVAGASKISRDLTATRRLEAQFVEAQKMEVVGRLAAGTAHDFNNYLSVILGRADLMLVALGAGDPMRWNLEIILQAAKSAAIQARQLLIFSRREQARPVPLDLGEVVRGLDGMLRQLMGRNIDLTIVAGPEAPQIEADPRYLGQLLLNLAVNARDAMPDGGSLTIATGEIVLDGDRAGVHAGVTAGSHALLTVSDTGTGMSDEVKARLFEPFFTTKPEGQGTGLGLATCETIARQFGGHIEVESEPGAGATFRVTFPAADPGRPARSS